MLRKMALGLLVVTLHVAGAAHSSTASGTATSPAGTLVNVAGGSFGDGLPAARAVLAGPRGIEVGPDGIVIADTGHDQLRVVGEDGIIRRLAGTWRGYGGDGGPALEAQMAGPRGMDYDGEGNLYVADGFTHRIRRIDAETGAITTVAGNGTRYEYSGDGGPATEAAISWPHDVAVGPDGSLYIADYENLRVRRVAPDGTMSTYAGNGSGLPAVDGISATHSPVDAPTGVAADAQGDVYIADEGNCSIRKVDAATQVISTVAGGNGCGYGGDGGPATQARLVFPQDVEVDDAGRLWIVDRSSRVRMVETDGTIRTVGGKGSETCDGETGPAPDTAISRPFGVAVDHEGNAFVTSYGCSIAWKIDVKGLATRIAGSGRLLAGGADDPADQVGLWNINSVAVSPDGELYFSCIDCGALWRRATREENGTRIMTVGPSGNVEIVAGGPYGDVDGPAADARFGFIDAMEFDDTGRLWIADRGAKKIKVLADGIVTTVAGSGTERPDPDSPDGPALAVDLYQPRDVAPAPDGSVYITEGGLSGRLRLLRDGEVVSLNAGWEAPGYQGVPFRQPLAEAKFNRLTAVDVAPNGTLYVVDFGMRAVWKLEGDTLVRLAGDGGWESRGDGGLAILASVEQPEDVAVDERGNVFILQDRTGGQGYTAVRMVSPSGVIQRVVGTGQRLQTNAGAVEGPLLKTPFVSPERIAVGPEGLYIADFNAVKLAVPSEEGWPNPPRNVICDPYAPDVIGDAIRWFGFSQRGFPNKDWLDIEVADVRTTGGTARVDFELRDLSEAALLPPDFGSAHAWIYTLRTGNNAYKYLAAFSPITAEEINTEVVHYEYGDAQFLTETSWTLQRRGAATGTFDIASDTITISAPLSDLGLQGGDLVIGQEAGSGSLVETGLSRFTLVVDEAPGGGTSRSYEVGRDCPESFTS